MTEERSNKFQWISVVYLVLFVMAVFSPSIVRGGLFGVSEQHIEEILIFLFGVAGLAIFMLYERLMERAEKEHNKIQDTFERVKRELVSSYQYIGSLNRQLDTLKQLTNDTSVSIYEQNKISKDLLHSLVRAASGSVGGKAGVLRFVHLDKLRTEAEFHHKPEGNGQSAVDKVSNKELKRIHDQGIKFDKLVTENRQWLVIPSDRQVGEVKAFMVLDHVPAVFEEFDPSVLKVFVNQAELVFRALNKENLAENGSALDLVDAATSNPTGTVE